MRGEEFSHLPRTRVGTRLAWVFDVVRSARTPSEAEVVSNVAPWVLEMIAPDQFVASFHELHDKLGLFSVLRVQPDDDLTASAELVADDGDAWEVRCSVSADAPNLIERLVFSPAEPDDGLPGYVVLLNGTSSSGKSSIAQQLQALLDDRLWLHVPIDAFLGMLPRGQQHGLKRFFAGTHQAVAHLARAGNSVILDCVLEEREWFEQLVSALDGIPTLYVGVTAPLEVLMQREQERGDRKIGLARLQHSVVHRHSPYDLELDTSALTPAECAKAIRDRLARGPGTVLDQVRASLPGRPDDQPS